MDELIYTVLCKYFATLENVGYVPYSKVQDLLVLCFYRDLVYHDYKGLLREEDYHTIEKALNCLYGKNCLIPYPDYLKMGKLQLGGITEMASRMKKLEDVSVVKVIHDLENLGDDSQSDIKIIVEEEGA